MSLIKCPECSHAVSDKAESCPNCGFPITSLVKCPECGNMFSCKADACPNCGIPVACITKPEPSAAAKFLRGIHQKVAGVVKPEHSAQKNDSAQAANQASVANSYVAANASNASGCIKFVLNGDYSANRRQMVQLVVNGEVVGDFSVSEGFELVLPANPGVMHVELIAVVNGKRPFGYSLTSASFDILLDENEDCTCKINYYKKRCPNFGYYLYNHKRKINIPVQEPYGFGMMLLCILLPLIGLVCYFVKRVSEPIRAKSAIYYAVYGFAVNLGITIARIIVD